jgi:hypothetical protein
MRKTILITLLIFNAFNSFCQSQKEMADKMFDLTSNNKDEDAKTIALDLLNLKFGTIDNETNFYAQYVISDYYYGKRKYKIGLQYFNNLLEFAEKNELTIEDKKQLLKDIKSKIKDLKDLLPDDSTSDESVLAEIKRNSNTDINLTQTTTSNKTSDTNRGTTNTASDKTVTLKVSGTGKTPEEAKNNALRSALEQAFGAFISSKTEILNDDLVKDEIISVANGNIQKFLIISEVQIPNGDYAASLQATVSVTKLTSFVESKGVFVEFKGSLFAFNVNQQILNEKNEIKAIENLCQVIKNIADNAFDYNITVFAAESLDNTNTKWKIPLQVSVLRNKNFDILNKLLFENLKGLSLTKEEADDYIKLNKVIYPVSIALSENDYSYIFLRTEKGITELIKLLYYFNHSIQNFKISNEIEEWLIKDNPTNIIKIDDSNFRLFLKQENNGSDFGAYCKASIFYSGTCNMRGKIILDCKNFQDNIDLKDFETALSSTRIVDGNRYNIGDKKNYFNNQFTFVNKLNLIEGKIYDSSGGLGGRYVYGPKTGLVISFVPSNYSEDVMGLDKKNQDNKEIVRFYYEDIRDIKEINKISEYKVLPNTN